MAAFADAIRGGVFLSTLPARGATHVLVADTGRGGISIHAPREGSDKSTKPRMEVQQIFLSTLPARGATRGLQAGNVQTQISIHAPREGSDSGTCCTSGSSSDFYPRSPRGERRCLYAGRLPSL